eukprot:gene427-788_t
MRRYYFICYFKLFVIVAIIRYIALYFFVQRVSIVGQSVAHNNQTRICFIVPVRDRYLQKNIFTTFIQGKMSAEKLKYTLLYAEQTSGNLFNRGLLLNVGYAYLFNVTENACSYVYLHDVDMLTESTLMYGNYSKAAVMHLATNASQFDYVMPYPNYIGGIVGVMPSVFELVDGFSNCFWGWGGEDDDFYDRLMQRHLNVYRTQRARIISLSANHTDRFSPEYDRNVKLLHNKLACTSGLADTRRYLRKITKNVAPSTCYDDVCTVKVYSEYMYERTHAKL